MPPDLKMTRGDTLTFDVYATRAEAAINLAGAKAWFYVKKETRDSDDDAVISYDTVADPLGIRVVDAALGLLRVTILPAESVNLPATYLPYDVQLRESDGTITTIAKGFIEVDRDSTITQA
jgi:hypothetical protein